MTASGDDETNNRVTTREFYEMQLKMRDDMNNGFTEVKQEITQVKTTQAEQIGQVKEFCKKAQQNEDDITSIKRRSNALDAGVLLISAAWTGLIALVTSNK